MLGPLSLTLDYPLAYFFDSLHLNVVWNIPMLLLMPAGLVGLHTRQAGSRGYGTLGTAGFSRSATSRAVPPGAGSFGPASQNPSLQVANTNQ